MMLIIVLALCTPSKTLFLLTSLPLLHLFKHHPVIVVQQASTIPLLHHPQVILPATFLFFPRQSCLKQGEEKLCILDDLKDEKDKQQHKQEWQKRVNGKKGTSMTVYHPLHVQQGVKRTEAVNDHLQSLSPGDNQCAGESTSDSGSEREAECFGLRSSIP